MKLMKNKKIWSVIAFIGVMLTVITLTYNMSIYSKIDALEESGGGFFFNYRAGILLIGIVLLVIGLMRMKSSKHTQIINGLFLAPALIAFFITVIMPFFIGIFYSMTDWNGLKFTQFVGLANYIEIFSEMNFKYSFGITFVYTLLNAVIVNIVAFLLALLVTSQIKGKNFYKAAYFVPNLIGGIVLGYVWQFIFNRVLPQMMEGTPSMLTDPNSALCAIIIVGTWQYAGYIMMIYVTGLQSVPQSMIEASSIDGARYIQILRYITMPMITNVCTVCTFLTVVNSFKQFDLNYAITNGGPSRIVENTAVFSTEFLALNIYKTAIMKNEYAIGQAKAVVFFVIIACVALLQVYINKKKEVEL